MSSRNKLNEVAEDKTAPMRLLSMLLLLCYTMYVVYLFMLYYYDVLGKKKSCVIFSL